MLRTDSVHAPRLGFVGYWTTGQPRISCIAVRLRSSLASLSLNQILHTERPDRTDFTRHNQRLDPLICLWMVRIHSSPPPPLWFWVLTYFSLSGVGGSEIEKE